MINTYDIYLVDNKTEAKVEKVFFNNLKFSYKVNTPTTVTCDIPLMDAVHNVVAGKTRIMVYRNGTVVFYGIIWMVTITSDSGYGSCVAQDMSSLLQRRILKFDKQGVNFLVDLNQFIFEANKDFKTGLYYDVSLLSDTEKSINTSTIQYKAGASIFDCINSMFSIVSLQNHFYSVFPDGRMRFTELGDFELGRGTLSSKLNVDKYSIPIDGRFVATRFIATDRGGGVYGYDASDLTTNDFQLLEQGYQFTELQDGFNDEYKGIVMARLLNRRSSPLWVPQITCVIGAVDMFDGSFELGSAVTAYFLDKFYKTFILVGYDVAVTGDGADSVSMVLNNKEILLN